MKDEPIAATAQKQSKSHKWGSQLRREIDTLIRATEGLGASALFEALAAEACIADDGTLCSSDGTKGYAWDPQAQVRKGARNPAGERVKAAGASLGRVMTGGHPDHRTYLAFLQALYIVTTQQDYDVVSRIEMLWDQMAYDEPETEEPVARERGWFGRLLDRLAAWFRGGVAL